MSGLVQLLCGDLRDRQVVTIGHHHQGPHVDALMALAERCGAVVLRLPEEGECGRVQWSGGTTPHELAMGRSVRRASYAGFDPDDLRIQAWRMEAAR